MHGKDHPLVIYESSPQLGTVEVTISDSVKGECERVDTYVFGMAEIKIIAKVIATNKTFKATLDLLE